MENRESTRHREFRRRKLLFENREEVEDENISIVYDDELTFILFFARHGATAAIPSEFRGTDAFAAFGGKNAK